MNLELQSYENYLQANAHAFAIVAAAVVAAAVVVAAAAVVAKFINLLKEIFNPKYVTGMPLLVNEVAPSLTV